MKSLIHFVAVLVTTALFVSPALGAQFEPSLIVGALSSIANSNPGSPFASSCLPVLSLSSITLEDLSPACGSLSYCGSYTPYKIDCQWSINYGGLTALPSNILSDFGGLASLDFSFNSISALTFPLYKSGATVDVGFLNISHNLFDNLNFDFTQTSSLRSLDMSFNKIPSISNDFKITAFFRYLDLSHNKITAISSTFSFLDSLYHLDLSHNSLSQLYPSTFEQAYGISSLNLGYNKFSSFPEGLLPNNLNSLYLDHNLLTKLASANLEGTPYLNVLDLSYNSLKSIETSFVGGPNGFQFDILNFSHNLLDDLNLNFCDLYTLASLDLSFNQFSVIPSDFRVCGNCRNLYLNNNQIASVSDDFKFLSNLLYIDLSQNSLSALGSSMFGLSNLDYLNMGYNKFTSFPRDNLARSVSSLYLYHNSISALASDQAFTIPNLKILDLSYNKISTMETPFATGGMTVDVDVLNISHNLLDNLTLAFNGQFSLASLDMSFNKFTFIPNDFELAGNCKYLDLSHNQISNIYDEYRFYPYIRDVDLSYNSLTTLNSLTFYSTNSLSNLYLSHNSLSSLSSLALNEIHRMSTLDMSYNQFTYVPVGGLPQGLSSLYLDHNSIETLENVYLSDNMGLRVWDMSYNRITNLPDSVVNSGASVLNLGFNSITTISGLYITSNLNSLYLNNNQIHSIPFSFKFSSSIQFLDLTHNSISALIYNDNYQSFNTANVSVSYNCLDCDAYKRQQINLDCDQSTQTKCEPYYTCPDEMVRNGCFDCTSDSNPRCLTCDYGYKLSACQCSACQNEECFENNTVLGENPCAECSESSSMAGAFLGCTSCLPGSYLDSEQGTRCELCPTDGCCPGGTLEQPALRGCLTCSPDQTKCEVCMERLRPDSEGKCVNCGNNTCCYGSYGIFENCFECSPNDHFCGSCEVGFYNVDGRCVKCGENECCKHIGITKPESGNCSACRDDGECGECLDGFFLSYGQCIDTTDPSNQNFFLKEFYTSLCGLHTKIYPDSKFSECCSSTSIGRISVNNVPECYGKVTADKDGFVIALDLSNIDLVQFSPKYVAYLTRLENLSLSSNNLDDPNDVAFDGPESLRYLDLSNNSFNSFIASVTLHAQKKSVVRDESQKASSAFSNLDNLESLDLSQNSLVAIDVGLFDSLSALQELSLESNSISSLSGDSFQGLTSLESLDIGSNELTSLPPSTFDQLTVLNTLNMNDNSLTSLPPDVFQNLPSLTEIDLSGNGLTSIPSDLFYSQTTIKQLTLDNNNLTSIPESVLSKVSNVADMNLTGNCIDCSNELYSYNKMCQSSSQTQCSTAGGCSRALLWSGCISCSDNQDTARCLACSDGYILKKNKCQKCLSTQCCPEGSTAATSSNCAKCAADRQKCSVCVAEYTMKEGKCSNKASSGSSLALSVFTFISLIICFVL